MRIRAAATALAVSSLAISPASAKWSDYAAGVSVQSVSGGQCLDSSGASFAGVLQYAGLPGRSAFLRVPLAQLGVVSTQALTISSGVGTAHPSGTFTWKGVGPQGTVWNVSGSFQASITTVDVNSYVFAITESYGGCSESSYIAATSLRPR